MSSVCPHGARPDTCLECNYWRAVGPAASVAWRVVREWATTRADPSSNIYKVIADATPARYADGRAILRSGATPGKSTDGLEGKGDE